MPYKDKPTEKLFYTIDETAKMFNVNVSLIRFWEKEFSILKPKKNNKGNRLFTKKDIENLKIIYHLVKERKYSFRNAYLLASKIVNFAEKKKKNLNELTLDEIKRFDKNVNSNVLKIFNVKNSMNSKNSYGGTSERSVKNMIKLYKKELK